MNKKSILYLAPFLLLVSAGCHPFANQSRPTVFPIAGNSLLTRPAQPQTVIEQVRLINAPSHRIWSLLADYGNVHQFVPSIKDSKHIAGPAKGVGAVRECTVALGMKVTEDVELWDEGKRMVINMHSKMPVKNHQADFMIVATQQNQSQVTFVMRYQPKLGFAGRAMNEVMIKKMMSRSMTELLDGLEARVKLAATLR